MVSPARCISASIPSSCFLRRVFKSSMVPVPFVLLRRLQMSASANFSCSSPKHGKYFLFVYLLYHRFKPFEVISVTHFIAGVYQAHPVIASLDEFYGDSFFYYTFWRPLRHRQPLVFQIVFYRFLGKIDRVSETTDHAFLAELILFVFRM